MRIEKLKRNKITNEVIGTEYTDLNKFLNKYDEESFKREYLGIPIKEENDAIDALKYSLDGIVEHRKTEPERLVVIGDSGTEIFDYSKDGEIRMKKDGVDFELSFDDEKIKPIEEEKDYLDRRIRYMMVFNEVKTRIDFTDYKFMRINLNYEELCMIISRNLGVYMNVVVDVIYWSEHLSDVHVVALSTCKSLDSVNRVRGMKHNCNEGIYDESQNKIVYMSGGGKYYAIGKIDRRNYVFDIDYRSSILEYKAEEIVRILASEGKI